MAGVKKNKINLGYGFDNALQGLAPQPIIATRAPTGNDIAELGTTWVDKTADAVYVITSVVNGSAVWSTSPASGVGTFTSVDVDPGDLTVVTGNVDITAGNLAVGGDTTLTGALTVNGVTTLNGDIDFSSSLLIDLTSTLNAAPSILLEANGGTSEQIKLYSNQGTGVSSIYLTSDVGGLTLESAGLASADAINITATLGGIDMDSALLTSITSSRNNAQAILLEATAGGIDITAAGAAAEDIDITCTAGSVNITAGESAADSIVISSTIGGIDISAPGAAAGEDIDITATSSINIESTENAALAVYLHANGGTSETIRVRADQGTGVNSVDILSDVGGITLTGGLGTADAINLACSDAAGGIDIDAGTGGIAIDSTGAFSIDGAAASNVTVTGAGVDLTLASVLGSVLVSSTEDAANAIMLHANGGTTETIRLRSDQGTGVASIDILSDVGGITLTSGLASADAINLAASAGGVDIDGALQVNIASSQNAGDAIVLSASAGGIDILATGAAAEDIDITNTGGSVNVTATEDAALAIYLRANGGTSETIRIHSDQGTGVGSVNLLSDVGGITLASGLASADAINLEASAGGIDMDAALQINIASSQDAASSIVITSSAGGIDILAAGAAAGEDIDIIATGSSVNINSTENVADSIVISSTNGGIDITASGAAAGEDIDISASSSINLTSTENVAQAIYLRANAGTSETIQLHADQGTAATSINLVSDVGGITLNSGTGIVRMVPQTATSASPTASATIDANVGVATFTGFTTASAGTQTFTITNSTVATTSALFVTVSNLGANDAQMTVQRVKQLAGSFEVYTKNNGAAALNGNVMICFWVFNP